MNFPLGDAVNSLSHRIGHSNFIVHRHRIYDGNCRHLKNNFTGHNKFTIFAFEY